MLASFILVPVPILLLLLLLHPADSLSQPATSAAAPGSVFAGIDIGTSGCRIILLKSPTEVIYSKSVLFNEISSDVNAYRDPSVWIKGINRLVADLPAAPSALSISSTSNSLLHVDSRTFAPISVSMYDASYFEMLASQPTKLSEVELGIEAFLSSQSQTCVEDPTVDLQTPFAPTGGVSKVRQVLD